MASATVPAPAAARLRWRMQWLWALPIVFLAGIVLYPLLELCSILVQKGLGAFVILASPRFAHTLGNTLEYTALTTAWALLLGLPFAWLLSRSHGRAAVILRAVMALGFVLPEFIYAIAYVFLFEGHSGYLTRLIGLFVHGLTPPLYGLAGMSLITGLYCVPQIAILVEPALRNLGGELDEAAELCGAGLGTTLWRITIPLVLPAILTATLFTVLLAFGSFGIPAALGIPVDYYVLSTQVYSLVTTYPPAFDQAAALSLVFLFVGLLVAGGQIAATRMAARYRTIGGKGFRRRRHAPPPALRIAGDVYLWLIAALASVLPLAVVFAVSFAVAWWQLPGPLTLGNYGAVVLGDPLFPTVAWTTASVTVVTVAGALLLATALALFSATHRGSLAAFTRLLGFVALSVPPIAFTIGALLAYIGKPFALYGTMWILVVTYWARFYPLAAAPINDGFLQLDPALTEAALIAGAGPWRALTRVQLPLLRPVIIAAGLVVMMYTMRELLSAVFLQSSQVKMAMVSIFNYWDEGSLERAAALSAIIVLVCVLVFFIANRFQTGAGWRKEIP